MMNSGLRRLLSGAVALMLLGCSSALADTATVTARKLILREKASSTSDALQTLPKGTKLEVLGKSGSWYKVTYGKYTGYVYKTYVSVTKTASSSSSSSSTTRLEKGSTGSDVKELQTKLKKLGYYDAYVDGDYGDTTVAAVKAFQKKYNRTALQAKRLSKSWTARTRTRTAPRTLIRSAWATAAARSRTCRRS